MKKFIKLNEKELEESLVTDTIDQIKRSIARKTMDLEDAVLAAKKNLNEVSTITSLKNFDAAKWVSRRNDALNELKIAKAEYDNFTQNFQEE